MTPALQQLFIEFFILIGSAAGAAGVGVLLVLFVEKRCQKGGKRDVHRVSK